jgi:hypothetical protein
MFQRIQLGLGSIPKCWIVLTDQPRLDTCLPSVGAIDDICSCRVHASKSLPHDRQDRDRENLLSSSIVCGSMAPSSNGHQRRLPFKIVHGNAELPPNGGQ